MTSNERIVCFITTLRNTWIDMETLFMEGQNDAFHKVLTSAFYHLQWQYWYDPNTGRVYSKHEDIWYSIQGEHLQVPESCQPGIDLWDSEIDYINGYKETRRLVDLHYDTA